MFKGLIRGFEGSNQVRIARTIGVSRGDLGTSYPCAGGVQYNLIWAMKLGQQKDPKESYYNMETWD